MVRTDMSKQAHHLPNVSLREPSDAATSLLDSIFNAKPEDNGKFLSWTNEVIIW